MKGICYKTCTLKTASYPVKLCKFHRILNKGERYPVNVDCVCWVCYEMFTAHCCNVRKVFCMHTFKKKVANHQYYHLSPTKQLLSNDWLSTWPNQRNGIAIDIIQCLHYVYGYSQRPLTIKSKGFGIYDLWKVHVIVNSISHPFSLTSYAMREAVSLYVGQKTCPVYCILTHCFAHVWMFYFRITVPIAVLLFAEANCQYPTIIIIFNKRQPLLPQVFAVYLLNQWKFSMNAEHKH